jgi:2-oxo-4-hydroxy-4-carboxy--5-ureidoimidazoline (OHCU) decarboxylase
VLFATVAVIGIQTLSRVDLHDERNVIVVAISLGLALVPVAFPTFYQNFPQGLQIIVGSGITMGSLSAIILNLVFNVLGGRRNLVEEVEPTPRVPEKISIDQVNDLSRERFVEEFGPLFQGTRWVAEGAWDERPFGSLYDLRRAFLDAMFDAPPERQLELIRSYPDLGRMAATDQTAADLGISPEQYEALYTATVGGVLSPESIRDQSSAGLDRLSPQEYEEFDRLNKAYKEKFGFPFVMAVKGRMKEDILAAFEERLEHDPDEEFERALAEIERIALLRLKERLP